VVAPFKLGIFDLDGTLFRGEEPIPGAARVLENLRARGIFIRYLTNNSSQTRETYAAKLTRLGFQATPEECYSSAVGTAAHLMSEGLHSAFVIGEPGLKSTLSETEIDLESLEPAAVVVGICKSFNYDVMNQAMQFIRGGSRFVATNADPTYPVEGGHFIPGSGSIVAAIQTCSETEPFIVGKPNPYLVDLILRDAGVEAKDALVVGDRMDTDIEAGKRAGCPTLLVLTGAAVQAPEGQAWLPSVADIQ
jgi:4-nitrophenyl phosphatase